MFVSWERIFIYFDKLAMNNNNNNSNNFVLYRSEWEGGKGNKGINKQAYTHKYAFIMLFAEKFLH
jgi:hypothetical protein